MQERNFGLSQYSTRTLFYKGTLVTVRLRACRLRHILSIGYWVAYYIRKLRLMDIISILYDRVLILLLTTTSTYYYFILDTLELALTYISKYCF